MQEQLNKKIFDSKKIFKKKIEGLFQANRSKDTWVDAPKRKISVWKMMLYMSMSYAHSLQESKGMILVKLAMVPWQ